jgi:hypothetical protein
MDVAFGSTYEDSGKGELKEITEHLGIEKRSKGF